MSPLDLQTFSGQGSFNPVERPDLVSGLRQQQQRLLESQRVQMEGEITNMKAAEDVRRIREAQTMQTIEALQGLSTKAGEIYKEYREQRNLELETEGNLLAYQIGLPESYIQQYDQKEQQADVQEAEYKSMAANAESQGAPAEVVRYLRDLSGHKLRGFRRGIAERFAAMYPAFFEEAAGQVSINVNGQEITDANAPSSVEKAQISQMINAQFLSRLSGMGIEPAMLEKYLFPAMRSYEARRAVEYAETQKQLLQEERKAEAQDFLFNGIKSGNGGQAILDFIQKNQSEFGGLGNARKVAVSMIEEMVKARDLTRADIDSILSYEFQANDGSRTTIGEKWGRDFVGIEDLLFNASRTDLQQEMAAQEDARNEFKLLFDQQTAERRSQGKDWTEAEIRAIKDDWEAKGLGAAPDWLQNFMTKEDRADELDKERLLEVRRSRGYLTEEDLRNVSTNLYSQMIGYVKEDKALSEVPKAYGDEAKQKIAALTAQRLNETEGNREKTPAYYNALYNAQHGYERYYRENIRTGMSPNDAHIKAMERVEKNMTVGTYTKVPTASGEQQSRINYARASKAWASNPNLVNTTVLPGTERDLQVLEQYAKTGRGSIPFIYQQLAQGSRGLTAWDIANAQLQTAGKGSLLKPRAVEYVNRQDPQLRMLLNWRPSAGRTNRAAMSGEGFKPLLDLVASQESSGYGGYDAMNAGGSAGGTVAYGSANSKNVFGRGLSQMSIGEVMQLQAQGKLHAAGRYQIIGGTLKGLIQSGAAGLTVNDAFDAANQDRLAMALVRRRLQESNKLRAFRNEWVGLRKVSDQVLMNAISRLQGQSPFNDPSNLHPQVVYRIGNLGYGSTGPHLDLKRVDRGRSNTTPSVKIDPTEVDNYVEVKVKNRWKPLSKGTSITDGEDGHRQRGSYGIDYAADAGTPVRLRNGARVVQTFKGDEGTDHMIIELPDGRRFQFLHGTSA